WRRDRGPRDRDRRRRAAAHRPVPPRALRRRGRRARDRRVLGRLVRHDRGAQDLMGAPEDLDPALAELVTVQHATLVDGDGRQRRDRVSRGAARAMAKTGWEIVPDDPVEPPAVPIDADPTAQVTIWHPELRRRQTLPAGAARAHLKSGWVVDD